MKTKEQRTAYNKEYSSRPEVVAWAKIRNARPERKQVRKEYKKSELGKGAEKRYRETNKEKINARLKANRLKYLYGISIDQYKSILEQQEGRCAICNTDSLRMHLDHDHITGNVRGILCTKCNMGIGLLKDDFALLQKAVDYLKKYVPTDNSN